LNCFFHREIPRLDVAVALDVIVKCDDALVIGTGMTPLLKLAQPELEILCAASKQTEGGRIENLLAEVGIVRRWKFA